MGITTIIMTKGNSNYQHLFSEATEDHLKFDAISSFSTMVSVLLLLIMTVAGQCGAVSFPLSVVLVLVVPG